MQIPTKIFGAWKKVYNRVTLEDVASLAGISKVSISRIMNSGACSQDSFDKLEAAFIDLATKLRSDDKTKLEQLEVD